MIAIITARGGSKRIPRKNIKPFMGKPMLAYAIEAARESGLFERIMVSTDDEEIAQIAGQYGAEVPFMRSAATANDHATTADVLHEVIDEYAKRGVTFSDFCCIYPCVPFLTGEILRAAYEQFDTSEANMLVPVVRFSFPIQRAFIQNEQGYLVYREPECASMRSQDLPPTFHDVGMFYFRSTDTITNPDAKILMAMYEMREQNIQDIDTPEDWEMAELKYRISRR